MSSQSKHAGVSLASQWTVHQENDMGLFKTVDVKSDKSLEKGIGLKSLLFSGSHSKTSVDAWGTAGAASSWTPVSRVVLDTFTIQM